MLILVLKRGLLSEYELLDVKNSLYPRPKKENQASALTIMFMVGVGSL